jgi:hypothetical protein
VANSPEVWAPEFVAGLLDVTYTSQSRGALGSWLMAEEAPELAPGLPASAADKILYADLLRPDLATAVVPPVPSPSQWAANARAAVRQAVSNLLVQTDPSWTGLVASGWQPADARMAIEDVSGLLAVTRGGKSTVRISRYR